MDYYAQLKPQAAFAVKVAAKAYYDLKKQISGIKKRLESEEVNAGKLRKRIVELKVRAGESLSGGKGEYAKFQTSLRKRTQELEVVEQAIRTVRDEILPTKKENLTRASRTLSHGLLAFLKTQKGPADARLNQLLDAVVDERDSFVDSCHHIFDDYDLSLGVGQAGDVFPAARHERIDDYSVGCKFVPRNVLDMPWKKNKEKELTKS